MKFSLERGAGNMIIAYDVGSIQVHRGQRAGGTTPVEVRTVRTSVIITPEELIEDWQPHTLPELEVLHMDQVLGCGPEIVLLGTGRRLRFPPGAIAQACQQAGAGFEVMDTGAACRTYNVLANEGRRVAAALLMIEE